MKKPKISIVIPAYNEENFLPKLLSSLMKQTFPYPYEIIVVDNNSTDATARVAKSYHVRVLTEPKKGYAYACNKGFYHAKGEIIVRIDADCAVPKHWLQCIWNSFEKDPNLVAIGGPQYPLESYWWENLFWYPAIIVWMYFLKILGKGFLFCNIAIRRDAFLQTNGYNTAMSFGEDVDICLRLKKMGKVVFDLRIYIYTSMRRVQNLGVIKFMLGYGVSNQLAIWRRKKPSFGLDSIRKTPNRPIFTHTPWIYLTVTPVTLIFIISGIFSLVYKPTQHYIKKRVFQPIVHSMHLQTKLVSLYKFRE